MLSGLTVPQSSKACQNLIRRTRSFGRHHARANWCLRGARGAKNLALPGLLNPLQDLTTLTSLRIRNTQPGYVKPQLRVEPGILPPQFHPAMGNRTKPAPLKIITRLKNLRKGFQRSSIPVPINDSGILIFYFRTPFNNLFHNHVNRLQNIKRFEPCDHQWFVVFTRNKFITTCANDGADVTRPDKAIKLKIR